MKAILEIVASLFRYHKLKALAVLVSAAVFFVLLFPFSDLTDYVTGAVLDATHNKILFQADRLDLGFVPTLSVDGQNVTIDIATYPTLEFKSLSVSPSLFSLISLSSGADPRGMNVAVDADGFWGGKLFISHKPNGSNDEGAKKNHIRIRAESIQLDNIQDFVDAPVNLQGKATLSTDFDFYPGFDGQPEGELQMTSKGLKIPPSTIPTQMGPVPMPGVSWSALAVKAHLGGTNLILDDVSFGTSKDALSGRVKGQMNVKLDKTGLIMGAYDVKVELLLTSAAEKDLDTFLILLKDYRQANGSGGKYVFQVSANSAAAQPNLGRLSRF